MRCWSCQSESPQGKFCSDCGASLLANTKQVSSKAERRHLTVLFADLVGSTALSERMDREDLRDLVQAYQSLCAKIIRRHEGYVAQLLGDGLLIYFGFPSAHEDDARRAVRAGLEIVDAVRTVQAAGERLQVRIGIHSGMVVVGEIGDGERREQLAVGETPYFAHHVQTQADPGGVVMSEATERLVRGFFTIEELAQGARLERPSTALRLFRVQGATAARSRIEAASIAALTPFVGRKDEVAVLSRAWARVRKGAVTSVFVRGEPGIGKSRLIEVVKSWIDPDRHDLLECRCSPYYLNSSLHPVIEMLERRFGYLRAQSLDEKRNALEARVIALGLPPEEAVPLLAPLFSIPVGDRYPPSTLAPPKRRQLTLELLADCLVRLSVRQPTLFVLEDLHWADPTTLELMRVILNRHTGGSKAQLMLLLSARTDPSADLTCTREIHLLPLQREDSKTLVAHLTGRKALPDEVLGQLLVRAGGVPLFVEEVTKSILEGGAFRELDDRFELARPLPAGVVPASVRDSLMARIDRLKDSKPLAQLAATLGREFRFEVLKAVSSLDDALLAKDLARLIDAELVYQNGRPPEATYIFKHALIQDAAYDSLLKKTRQEYHARIALTLVEQFPHLRETEPELLARHFEGAGLLGEAVEYWKQAGDRAMARAANLEAIAHLNHASDLVNAQPTTAEGLQQELAIKLALGAALMAIKGYSATEARESYTRARQICRDLGDVPQLYPALWGLWAYYFVGGDLGQAADLGRQIHRLAKASDEPIQLTTGLHALCYPALYQAEYRRALELAHMALANFDLERERAIVREFQFSSTAALCDIAGTALWVLGYPDQGLKMAERGMALAAELKHPPTIAFAACSFAWGVPQLRREPGKVREAAETVLRLSGEEEFSFWPPLARIFLGWSHIAEGRIESWLPATHDAFKGYRAVGGGILRSTTFALLAEGNLRLGRFDEALQILEEGLANAASSQEHHYEQELHRLKGEVLSQLGRLDEAEACLRFALALTKEQGARSLELRSAISLARLGRKRKRSDALAPLADSYGWFTEGFETPDLIDARLLLADQPAE
jgi:class 3 adenylate cyclase/tetratricopeptide (TPR) repeat protein